MNAPLPPAVRARIDESLAAGRTLEALKLYREATGAGLAEAKLAVERLAAGTGSETSGAAEVSGVGSVRAAEGSVLEQIKTHLFAGHKIIAIKLYREATRKGLKESKEDMDRLEAELRQKSPEKFKVGGGCFSVLLAVALVLVAVLGVAALAGGWSG